MAIIQHCLAPHKKSGAHEPNNGQFEHALHFRVDCLGMFVHKRMHLAAHFNDAPLAISSAISHWIEWLPNRIIDSRLHRRVLRMSIGGEWPKNVGKAKREAEEKEELAKRLQEIRAQAFEQERKEEEELEKVNNLMTPRENVREVKVEK